MFTAALFFAEGEFAGGVGVAAEALVGTGEEEVGVGVGGVAAGGLFEVMGGGFEVALLQEDAAEFEMGAGGICFGCLFEEGGGFRQAALAEEKGAEVDAGIVRSERADGDGAAEMEFGVGVAAEGEIVETGGAMDAGRGDREREVEGFTGEFEPAQGVAVAGEEVATIDGRLFQLARAKEGRFGFGEAVGGDVGEADPPPLGGVVLRGRLAGEEEEEKKMPGHGAHSIACDRDILLPR